MGLVPSPCLPRLSAQSWTYHFGEAPEAVGVGHHHEGVDATLLRQRYRRSRAESRRACGRRHRRPAWRATTGERRRGFSWRRGRAHGGQKPDVGEAREAAADAGVMVENGDAVALEQRPQAVGLAGLRRLGDAEEQRRDLVLEAGVLDGGQRGDELRQSFGRAAGFGGDDEARGRRARCCPARLRGSSGRGCRRSACAAGPRALVRITPGKVPAADLGQRLAAETGATGAKKMINAAWPRAWLAPPPPHRYRRFPRGWSEPAGAVL